MTLRELINKLEKLSKNGLNDGLSVMVHIDEYMEQDCFGQDECVDVNNVYIDMFNNCGDFDESDSSYEFIKIKA